MSVSSNNPVNDLIQCINNTQHWMAIIFLQLNQDKTEILLVDPKTFRFKKLSLLTPLSVKLHEHVRNLGMIFWILDLNFPEAHL